MKHALAVTLSVVFALGAFALDGNITPWSGETASGISGGDVIIQNVMEYVKGGVRHAVFSC